MRFLDIAVCVAALAVHSTNCMRQGLGLFFPATDLNLRQGPAQVSASGQRCVLDCGKKGYVPGTCLCQEDNLFPFLFLNTPCRFATCSSTETCKVENGNAVCVPLNPKFSKEDVCNLRSVTGPCRANIKRYFFDKTDGKCKEFVYGGCQGNGNSFATKDECERFCITDVPATIPTISSSSVPTELTTESHVSTGKSSSLQTSPQTVSSEGEPGLVHHEAGTVSSAISATSSSPTAQTDASTDPLLVASSVISLASGADSKVDPRCRQPKETGVCMGYMPKFYYDSVLGRCEGFVYGGCGGNDNRFDTMRECQLACGSQLPEGDALVAVSGSERPAQCYHPMQVGHCRGAFQSFYFNADTLHCEPFIYGGCGGNSNRFETFADCERTCKPMDTCQQPKEEGRCRMNVPRWYYDSSAQKCLQFIYGGCGGNNNNFKSQADCERRCVLTNTVLAKQVAAGLDASQHRRSTQQNPSFTQSVSITSVPAMCQQPQDSGPCRAMKHMFYFDAQTGSCKTFVYGGCRGNDNRFNTEADCLSTCSPAQQHQQQEPVKSPSIQPLLPDVCLLPKREGKCFGYVMLRYYYNPATGQCERFIFSGCDGNGNNFRSYRSCQDRCESVARRQDISLVPH